MSSYYGPQPTANSTGYEIMIGLLIVAIAVGVFFLAEGLYKGIDTLGDRYVKLMDYTVSADDKSLVIHQDIGKYPDAKPILFSENEPSGVEFAYSFFMYINPNTFTGTAKFHHVWHKGMGCIWPLMGPAVLVHSNNNALRILMNTTENPYTYVDVMNIPVSKWFHVVLNCRKNAMEVYINGNLTNKIRFGNGVPYQNFQDIVLFSNTNYVLRNTSAPALGEETSFELEGTFKGWLSELIYTRYSLSFIEINRLLNAGPSQKVNQKSMDKPPYFSDNWWMTTVAPH